METICGIDCAACAGKESCKGCAQTNGSPLGGECAVAACYKAGGESRFAAEKKRLIEEFNALCIADMPAITELCPLAGAYVNLEYPLPGGGTAKLLDDSKIYLGWQVERPGSDRCYGLVADQTFLLVCEYGCNGAPPEIILYKRR